MYRFIQQNRKIRKDLDALRGTTVTVYISRTTSELTTFPDTGAGGGAFTNADSAWSAGTGSPSSRDRRQGGSPSGHNATFSTERNHQ